MKKIIITQHALSRYRSRSKPISKEELTELAYRVFKESKTLILNNESNGILVKWHRNGNNIFIFKETNNHLVLKTIVKYSWKKDRIVSEIASCGIVKMRLR